MKKPNWHDSLYKLNNSGEPLSMAQVHWLNEWYYCYVGPLIRENEALKGKNRCWIFHKWSKWQTTSFRAHRPMSGDSFTTNRQTRECCRCGLTETKGWL